MAIAIMASLFQIEKIIVALYAIIDNMDECLEKVIASLEEINEKSSGMFVLNLIEATDYLKKHYTDLICGMRKMAETIQVIKEVIEKVDEQSANNLSSVNSKLF